MSWKAQAALGVVWTVCGVVIGLSPPLSDSGRGAVSPFAGWLVVAFGIFLIVNGFRRAADPPSGKPRHSTGREIDRGSEIRLPLLVAAFCVAGAGIVAWGFASDRAALVCVGIVCASVGAVLVPEAVQALRTRLRR
ncbi:hypothetical protein [Mycolicibacterium sp. 120270]|uniref:hypothetical protein n=1 Tax=Mycolicibacterium sp. 120270 TaxID=3090600 RepID=UPI00299EED6B|nr:hypothetical protein [Mycolicibacterium sp. 120270]MDX1882180.1 hypothetical protein [Mycolicibacterium sp. 120270]